MGKYNNWSKKEYKLHIRIITTLSAGIIFLFLIQRMILWSGPKLDVFFGMPTIGMEPYRMIFIILLPSRVFVLRCGLSSLKLY